MLTDTACKNAKSTQKPYKLTDSGGLFLLVTPSGAKYWRLNYRYAGRQKTLAIGVYPVVGLGKARELRLEAKRSLASGIDPSAEKQSHKQKLKDKVACTFERVAREWHNTNVGKWKVSHGNDILHRLERDIFPEIGSAPIADLRPRQILDAIRLIEQRGAFETAKRTLQYCGQVFRYGGILEYCDHNPTECLRGALRPFSKEHHAAIESEEIPELLSAMNGNHARLYEPTRNAIWLMLLTFVRTSELIQAKWSEINFDEKRWLIKHTRMKKEKDHIVPLCSQALKILESQRKYATNWGWVFPGQSNPTKHMSNNTILKALERMGFKGRMTGHGFRALAMSTIKERIGYRHEVVDRQLAHSPHTKNDAAYDRAKYMNERKKMMQEWADYLDGLLKDNQRSDTIAA